ncbi:MAG TPA: CPBP family glutamic-type intramembrane protease [Bacillota bacterium]
MPERDPARRPPLRERLRQRLQIRRQLRLPDRPPPREGLGVRKVVSGAAAGLRRFARRISPRNALAITFWLLVSAAVIGAGGVFLAALFPEAAGISPDEFIRDEAYRVTGVEIDRGHLHIVLPDGHIVPVYRSGRLTGAVLVGAGRYVLEPDAADAEQLALLTGFERIQDNVTAVYVNMEYREFENIRYAAGGRRDDDGEALDRARNLLERRREAQPTVAGAGLAALFREPNQEAVFAQGADLGVLVYRPQRPHEARFLDLGSVTIRFDDGSGQGGPFNLDLTAPISVALFASVLLLLLIMVMALTADVEPVHPADGLRLAEERATWVGALLLVVVEVVIVYLDQIGSLVIDTGWLYGAFAVLALLRPLRAGPRGAVTGLSPRYALRALVTGLLVGVLGFLGASLGLPYGIDPSAAADWPLLLAQGFLLQGLATEVYRRGLLQTTLQAWLGRRPGLLVAPLLVGLLYIVPRMLAQPAAWAPLLVEGLVLVALGETIFAFLFDRTGSTWAGTVARGVLYVAQRLLLY